MNANVQAQPDLANDLFQMAAAMNACAAESVRTGEVTSFDRYREVDEDRNTEARATAPHEGYVAQTFEELVDEAVVSLQTMPASRHASYIHQALFRFLRGVACLSLNGAELEHEITDVERGEHAARMDYVQRMDDANEEDLPF